MAMNNVVNHSSGWSAARRELRRGKRRQGRRGRERGRRGTSVSILKRAESEVFAPFAFYRATSGGCGGSHSK